MPIIKQHRIYRLDLVANRNVLYVFGDNDQRVGKGGQARECRGAENAVGIRTKKGPGTWTADYYTDDELEDNCLKIDQDFERLFRHIGEGGTVVWPIDGVGTGLAQLSVRAPKTLDFIERMLQELERTDAALNSERT